MTKENLISNITTTLIDTLGIETTNKVKDILILEMRNIEIKEKETALVVSSDKRAYIIQKFIACKKLSGLTERSLKAYYIECLKFLEIINKNIEDITVDDVRYYLALSKKKRLSDVTIDNQRRYLNTFFDWCLNEEIIKRNPVKKIDKIKTTKKQKEAFTEYEIEKMRSFLVNEKTYCGRNTKEHLKEIKLRNIAIFETLLSTGARVTELINIDKNQVEEEQDELIILGKGKKERKIYLNAKARISIQNYLQTRKDFENCLFVAYDPFKDNLPHRMSQAGIEDMIRTLGKRCDIEAYPHKFRRTAATIGAKKGMPIEQIQKMLGHSSLNTTQIYVNTSDNEVKISHEKYLN